MRASSALYEGRKMGGVNGRTELEAVDIKKRRDENKEEIDNSIKLRL